MRMTRFWLIFVIGLLGGCGKLTSPDFIPQLKGVVIEDLTPTRFETLGQTRQYRALALYSTPPGSSAPFTTEAVAAEAWESTETGVASIDNTGIATALRNGSSGIRARYRGFTSPEVTLTVIAPVLRAITLDPATSRIPLGLTQTVSASGSYLNADGSTKTRPVTEILNWVSGAPQRASVPPLGNPVIVSSLQQSDESVSIKASAVAADGTRVEGVASILIGAPELLQVVVRRAGTDVAPPFALPRGAMLNLQARGLYTDSAVPRDIPGAIRWTSADSGNTVLNIVAQPNGTLNVTGLNVGASSVTAAATRNDGVETISSAPATINVGAAALQSLDGARITPSPALVAVGASLPLTVLGRFTDGTEAAVPANVLDWVSADLAIATVSVAGVTSGLVQGSSVITATLKTPPASGAASVSAPLIVTDQICTGPLLASLGATVQTAATPVLCLACTVSDAPLAIDNDVTSFASINVNLGLLLGSASLTASAAADVPLRSAGQRAGFIISRPPGELLSLGLLGGVTVSTLDANGNEIESANANDGLRLTLLGSYVIGQDAFILSMPVTQPFRQLKVDLGAGLATAAQSLQVNSACAVAGQ